MRNDEAGTRQQRRKDQQLREEIAVKIYLQFFCCAIAPLRFLAEACGYAIG